MGTNLLSKIGKYDVIDVLGKGGMGVVYKAQDPRIGRTVAIKMMTGAFAENPDLLQRFYREAQSTGILQHPNIVIVHDLGDLDGSPYLVMEYLEGEALDKLIASRRNIQLVEKLDIIIQACNGLHYAHQRNIVHRDIKPANIMVLKEGGIKIVDFGIARLGDNTLTRTGQVVGTISYMSPEQISAKLVDRRTDIFSAGVMLYELLTFTLPFDAPDTASTLLKIVNEPPPPLSAHLDNVPPELEDVLQKALAKDRDERYQTAEDFAFDLGRVQEKLKRQLIDEHVATAKSLVAKSELPKAKELLLQVLRLESHHSVAKDLLAEVQQLLQKQQRNEQVRQLRSHAEDMFSQALFNEALSSLDQAIALDKTNAELLDMRKVMADAKTKKEAATEALRRAESAQQSGKLDNALQLIEEALKKDPNNAQLKAMHTALATEVAEQNRQQKVQGLLDEARKGIAARKFSQAFEVLQEAQKLDATLPEVHALLNLAQSGREQERKRRELQEFTTGIEDALNSDNYKLALEKAEAGLQKFPADPGLLKLKGMVEKQREAEEKRKFLEEQTSTARQLLDQGEAQKALQVLEKALQKVPGEPRLQVLMAIVRDSAERQELEQRKGKVLAEAKDALRRKEYQKAVSILEAAHAVMEGDGEISDMLQFARDEAAQAARRQKVESVAQESQKLMAEGEHEQAIALLQSTVGETKDEELGLLLQQAQRAADDERKKVDAAITRSKRLIETRKFDEAVAFLESQPKRFARSAEFCAALEGARGEQERLQSVVSALQKAKTASDRGDFKTALEIIASCRKAHGETPEIQTATNEVEGKRAGIAKTAVERAIRDARTLLLARQYNAVMKSLDGVADMLPHAPAELGNQIQSLRKEATSALERQKKGAQLDKVVTAESAAAAAQTIVAGSYEAPPPAPAPAPAKSTVPPAAQHTMVAGSIATPEAPAAEPEAPPAPKPAPAPAPSRRAPAPAPVAAPAPAPAKSNLKLIIGAVAAVLILAIGFVAYQKLSSPPPATTYIEVNAVPWCTVKYLQPAKGRKIEVNQPTPVRVAVPPGDYTIVVAGPDGAERSDQVKATNDIPGSYNAVFEQIDVEKLLKSY